MNPQQDDGGWRLSMDLQQEGRPGWKVGKGWVVESRAYQVAPSHAFRGEATGTFACLGRIFQSARVRTAGSLDDVLLRPTTPPHPSSSCLEALLVAAFLYRCFARSQPLICRSSL